MTWHLTTSDSTGIYRYFIPDITKAGVKVGLYHANMDPSHWYASDWVITDYTGATELQRAYIEWSPRYTETGFYDEQIIRRIDGLPFDAGTVYRLAICPPNHGGGIGQAQGITRCTIEMVD